MVRYVLDMAINKKYTCRSTSFTVAFNNASGYRVTEYRTDGLTVY